MSPAEDSARWAGRRVVVGGAGVSGAAVVRALLARGAQVVVTERAESPQLTQLVELGAQPLIAPASLPEQTEVFVVSPGWRPDHPLVVSALAAGIEVYSEPELAWRLQQERGQRPLWLAVTGTNGKTTTVTMTAAIIRAAGDRVVAAGNIGYPLVAAVDTQPAYDALAVELSSFQLHYSSTLAPPVAVLLNLADDHLDWHGGFDRYVRAKFAIWRDRAGVAIGNADDPRVLAALPPAQAGRRIITFTVNEPTAGQLGVREGMLVDHAFAAEPVELLPAKEIRPTGQHNVANALAAAALARAYGVTPVDVANGLRGYQPEAHRNQFIANVAGVDYVDDSKATNPHAALASLLAYERIVWVAGGQLKGVVIDDLVRTVAGRLRGAIVLGVDQADVAAALARHAPQLPVTAIAGGNNSADVMRQAVTAAAQIAIPGDTVLLAPAAASLDMFTSYAARGAAFADAVATLPAPKGP